MKKKMGKYKWKLRHIWRNRKVMDIWASSKIKNRVYLEERLSKIGERYSKAYQTRCTSCETEHLNIKTKARSILYRHNQKEKP